MIKNLKLKTKVLIVGISLTVVACQSKEEKDTKVHLKQKNMTEHNDNKIFQKGERLPNEWFTGNAFLQPLLARDKNNDFALGSVTFEPGARTHWHTHPKGQVLIVTEGEGFYQEKGKTAQLIKKGDVINIPENIEHWHGATATTQMVHIAVTNYKGEENVTWLKPVSNEEFEANK